MSDDEDEDERYARMEAIKASLIEPQPHITPEQKLINDEKKHFEWVDRERRYALERPRNLHTVPDGMGLFLSNTIEHILVAELRVLEANRVLMKEVEKTVMRNAPFIQQIKVFQNYRKFGVLSRTIAKIDLPVLIPDAPPPQCECDISCKTVYATHPVTKRDQILFVCENDSCSFKKEDVGTCLCGKRMDIIRIYVYYYTFEQFSLHKLEVCNAVCGSSYDDGEFCGVSYPHHLRLEHN